MRLGVCVSYFFNIHSFIMSLLPFLSHRAPFSASPLSLEFSTTDVSVCLTYDVTCTGACTNPHAHSLARSLSQAAQAFVSYSCIYMRVVSTTLHYFLYTIALVCTELGMTTTSWSAVKQFYSSHFSIFVFTLLFSSLCFTVPILF